MNNLEIREIEIPSPIDSLRVGDDFSYKGQYKDGYEEGISKIKRFYKDVPFWAVNGRGYEIVAEYEARTYRTVQVCTTTAMFYSLCYAQCFFY